MAGIYVKFLSKYYFFKTLEQKWGFFLDVLIFWPNVVLEKRCVTGFIFSLSPGSNLRSRKEGKEDYISNIAYMLLTDACKNTLCTLRTIMLSRTSRLVCPDFFFCKTKKLWNWAWNMFGLSIVLELKVENSTILTVNVIFLCQKSAKSFWFIFIEDYKKRSSTFIDKIFW